MPGGSGWLKRSTETYIPRKLEAANNGYSKRQIGDDETLTKYPKENFRRRYRMSSTNELLNSSNKLMEQMTTLCDLVSQAIQKKEEEKRIAEEQAAKDRY
ncbi:hypothetical protein Tco_1204476 [Tanacetum coccineum]